MSADNYAMCPQCSNNMNIVIQNEDERIKSLYGKVDREEWDKLIFELNNQKEKYMNRESTFREDYEIYNDDRGLVTIEYNGSCEECGLKADFKKEIKLT